MVPWKGWRDGSELKALAVLQKDLGSTPSNHMGLKTIHNSTCRGIRDPLLASIRTPGMPGMAWQTGTTRPEVGPSRSRSSPVGIA